MDNILSFIRPELFILVIFLYCVGLFLKLYKGFNKDWMIPMTLAYVCIFMDEGFAPPVIVAVIIQSVLIAAVTVFGNELIQQVLRRNE